MKAEILSFDESELGSWETVASYPYAERFIIFF